MDEAKRREEWINDIIWPRAELITPADYSSVVIGAKVEVQGRAVDAYFKRYLLSVSWSGGSTLLSDSAQPVWKGALGTWDTQGVNPGVYELSLRVEDQIENATEAKRTIILVHKATTVAENSRGRPANVR